jgi:AcrR family transcriptional regulator
VAVTEPAKASYGQADETSNSQAGKTSHGQAETTSHGQAETDSYGQEGPVAGFGRRADQLPSGRHGLLRSYVAANQRQRIVAAVASAAAELGYAEMSVEAIIVRAGVSRRTFYEHFKNKEDAFLAAYDAAVHSAVTRVRHAYLDQATAMDRLRAGIAAYLHFLAADPDTARMGIVEVLAAGPRAIARRADALHLFAAIIEDNIRELVPSCRNPALTAQTMVGGINEAVFGRILTGRTHELPGLADDLLTAILMLDVDPHELAPGSQPPLGADGAAL